MAIGSSTRTQKERRDATQKRLIAATLACLGELGYARTTTTEIVRAAGLSQGALFKCYPSKAELLAAAVQSLFEELVVGYQQAFVALPRDQSSPDAAFELLWRIFTGPRLAIAFELYLVARTDADLQRCLEPVVRHHRQSLVQHARTLFPEVAGLHGDFDAWIDLLMCAMEGMVVERYGAGDVTGPALQALKRLWLSRIYASDAPAPPRQKPRASAGSEARRRSDSGVSQTVERAAARVGRTKRR